MLVVQPGSGRTDERGHQRILGRHHRVHGAQDFCTSMIGFGRQPYRTADGKQHEWFAIGVAARKAALTLYGLTYDGSNADLLARLGPHTTGKGCLYLKRLADVDEVALRALVARAWAANHTPA